MSKNGTMKILFLIDSLAGGGAEKLIHDLLPLLNSQKGCACELLILSEQGEKYLGGLREHGVPVDAVPADCSSHFQRVRYIRKYISDGEYDVVHANLFPVFYYCALAKRLTGKRFPALVMTEHNTDNRRRHHKILRRIERFIYRSYDHVISISDATQQQLLDWLRPSRKWADRFSVIYNGIPLRQFTEARAYPRRELFPGIADTDVLLCMAGSFTEQKNHDGMLRVMALLPENYKLLLAGEGVLYPEITEQIRRMGLDRRVVCLGFRKDVAEIMHTADLVVIPSKWEGFGLIAAEAMACGKPVVASNVCGLAEVVGNAGITADCSRPAEFAQAILRLESKDLYGECRKNAEQRAERFSIARMRDAYMRVFESLLKCRPRGVC